MHLFVQNKLHPMVVSIALCTASLATPTLAQNKQATPGYNNKIPEKIMTPDKVQTSIGTLSFFDGMPSKATIDKVYDNLDRMRGVETFLNGMPAASLEAVRAGLLEFGLDATNKIALYDQLMDANVLLLTGNAETVYAFGILDLQRDGPTVVEIPPGAGPGTVNDAFFRFVIDMGGPGPDKGQGGKYLILPPDYKSDLEGPIGGKEAEVNGQKYFVVKSPSYINWLILRGFTVAGDPAQATKMWKEGLRTYPLSQVANPPKMEFISASKKPFNTVHANTFEFYDELNTVVQREPASMWDAELLGQFAAIGIQKGKPFAPDARMKKILTDAVAIGNATSRALTFRARDEAFNLYKNSAWKLIAGKDTDYQWLRDGGAGGRNLDNRIYMFYQATVNTPAMMVKMVGLGSQYAAAYTDKTGGYLDGSKTYKLHLPPNAPAKNFWSIVVYDPQTRSMLQTSQPLPSKASGRDKLIENSDGSIDLYYGPKAPTGKEANWTQTVPGKGWFAYLRLYGPLEPWFNDTWRIGEFELVK